MAAPRDVISELKLRLEAKGCVEDTLTFAKELDVPHESVVGAANSLFAKGCARCMRDCAANWWRRPAC